jgi:hypothetical protein
MKRFYEPDLTSNPDSPFMRDGDGKLVRRSYWMDMDDRTYLLNTHLINEMLTTQVCQMRKVMLRPSHFAIRKSRGMSD